VRWSALPCKAQKCCHLRVPVCAAAVLKKIPVELGSGKTRVSNTSMRMQLGAAHMLCCWDEMLSRSF
jgi:hypothetical protein